jgi:hypothetical protein
VTFLDVGHPLVRRLIEEVKQNGFRADALALEELESLLKEAVEVRRRELVAERRAMMQSFDTPQDRQEEAGKGTPVTAWLKGIDDLSPGSLDLLTVGVPSPA